MRLLDLFCGAGGAARGYYQAGFDEIVGVDIAPQSNYPFEFIQGDVLGAWLKTPLVDGKPFLMRDFDLIHASPPCQAYSTATADPSKHPDLVEPTRQLLEITGVPYVIENVEGAPLRAHINLCGSMFGLDIRRHHLFELSGFPLVLTPPCNHLEWEEGRPWTVTGTGGGGKYPHSWTPLSADHSADLMGMPRGFTKHEYSQAIPPAYTKFIGEQFASQLVRGT